MKSHGKIFSAFFLICASFSFPSCDKEMHYDLSFTKELLEEDHSLNAESDYIAILGDIQEYTGNDANYAYLKTTMNWIWSQHKYGKNIKCILCVGDLTNNNSERQWELFRRCTEPVAEDIPYVACIGNHDYRWDAQSVIHDRNDTRFTAYTEFAAPKAAIIERFEAGRMENIVVANTFGGRRCDILVLEFGPRDEVVEWAADYVSRHPDRRFILLTHEYLTAAGERITANSYAQAQFRNTSVNTPQQLWEKLVRDNDNIVCVICGHNGFMRHMFSTNSAGRDVPQILFNLQNQVNGGDGMIQLLEIPYGGDGVHVSTYNTAYRRFVDDPLASFEFEYR